MYQLSGADQCEMSLWNCQLTSTIAGRSIHHGRPPHPLLTAAAARRGYILEVMREGPEWMHTLLVADNHTPFVLLGLRRDVSVGDQGIHRCMSIIFAQFW